MTTKTKRIIYWIVTVLFAAFLVFDGIASIFAGPDSKAMLAQLQYPAYILIITGVAKILAGIAIVQTKFHTIKEWAFAGFAIDCLGASASWYFVAGINTYVIAGIVMLVIMLALPYTMWKKHWY